MFASLRYRRKHHYRSFCFASITLSFAFEVSERVYIIEACAVPGGVYTTEPELHSDVSALQRPVLFLEVSATGPELNPDVAALQRPLLFLEVSATGPELHPDLSALQRPVLFLEVSTPQSLGCILTCLHYRGLCCSWRCLHHRAWAAS